MVHASRCTWGDGRAYEAIPDCFLVRESGDIVCLRAGHLWPFEYGSIISSYKGRDRPVDKAFDKYFNAFLNEHKRILGSGKIELDVVRDADADPSTILSGKAKIEHIEWSVDNYVYEWFSLFGKGVRPVSYTHWPCFYIPFIDGKPLHDAAYNLALARVLRFYTQLETYVMPRFDKSMGKNQVKYLEEFYLDGTLQFGKRLDYLNEYIACIITSHQP